MPDVTITISQNEYDLMVEIAAHEGIPPKEYATNILRVYLKAQIRGIYQERFDSKTIAELEALFGPINP